MAACEVDNGWAPGMRELDGAEVVDEEEEEEVR
jgi:hypothetical protein